MFNRVKQHRIMRKLQIAIWAAALVATGSLQAQQRGTLAFGGAVLNQDGVLAGEMAQMSQPFSRTFSRMTPASAPGSMTAQSLRSTSQRR